MAASDSASSRTSAPRWQSFEYSAHAHFLGSIVGALKRPIAAHLTQSAIVASGDSMPWYAPTDHVRSRNSRSAIVMCRSPSRCGRKVPWHVPL